MSTGTIMSILSESCYSNIKPPPSADPYLQALDEALDGEFPDIFTVFGKRLVTVFSIALEISSPPMSKARLLNAFESQGASIDRTVQSDDMLRLLDVIRDHDNIHFAAMAVSTVAVINSVGR